MRFILPLLFFLPHLFAVTEHPFFQPPKEWLIANPTTYAPSVRISFVSPKKQLFPPSLNLAVEENVSSLEAYVEAVQKIHASDKTNRWRRLGTLDTACGKGVLTEIDTSSDSKPVRLLQLIVLRGQTAYILTGAALKKEMSASYEAFLSAFKSFTITENLLESIAEKPRRDSLLEAFSTVKKRCGESQFEKKVWGPFQKRFLKDFSDLGAYWQLLVLKQFQSELENPYEQ